MSTLRLNDRASLCTFTFADGRRCRTPLQSGHPLFCYFHARKQAQLQAAEALGRDFAFFFSGDYHSACDLAAAMGRLFAAVARGDVKPRVARTLASLAWTTLQTIQVAQVEFITAFGEQAWRDTIFSHVKENQDYKMQRLAPPPPRPTPEPKLQAPPQLTDQSTQPAPDNPSPPTTPSASAHPLSPSESTLAKVHENK